MTSTGITTEFDEASGSTLLIMYKLLCSDKNRSVVNQIHKLQDPIMQNYLGSLGNTAKKAFAHWLASLGGTTQQEVNFLMLVISQWHVSQLQKDVPICIEQNFCIYSNCQPFWNWDMTSIKKIWPRINSLFWLCHPRLPRQVQKRFAVDGVGGIKNRKSWIRIWNVFHWKNI